MASDEGKAEDSRFGPLCKAIQGGNLTKMKELISCMEEKDLKERDNEGNTLLLLAVKAGHLELVKWLLSSKICSLEERNENGYCPLIMAALMNHKDLIFYLLDAGLPLTTTTKKKTSLFMIACSSKASNLETCKWIFEKGNGLFVVNEENEFGRTPLMYALTKSDTSVSKWLIEQRASVHCESKKNENLFTFATWGTSNLDNLQLVLACIPEKINSYCTEECTPLLFAGREKENNIEAVKYLLEHGSKIHEIEKGDGSNILIQVAAVGAKETMKWLFDNYPLKDLHIPNFNGRTALHELKSVACAELLVQAGLDVNHRANDGSTPLLCSLKAEQYGVAEYLLSKGAIDYIGNENEEYPIEIVIKSGKVDLFTSFMERATCTQTFSISKIGFQIVLRNQLEMLKYLSKSHSLREMIQGTVEDTLIHQACLRGHKNIIDWLLANGFNWDEKNRQEYTPFNSCIQGGFKELAQFFIEKGASVNEEYKTYITPLCTSAACGRRKVYEWLVEEGAEQNVFCSLTAAVLGDEPEMVRYLASRGESVNDQESPCSGPIYNAVSIGNLEIAKLLVELNASLSIVPDGENNYLITSLSNGDPEMVEWVLNNEPGASLSQRDGKGNTCLLIAALKGNIRLINWLLQNGSSLEESNEAGQTLFTIPSEDPSFNENLRALFYCKKIKSARK